MELLLSVMTKQEFKEGCKSSHLMHCLSTVNVLQLASVQAANATPGIKHVYTTLMTLWKFFHYFPKRAESKEDSENTRSSRAQDGETVRHTLACT